jgi:HAMP domain-containing protein
MIYTGLEARRRAAGDAQAAALSVARFAAVEQNQLIEGTRQLLVGLSQLPEVVNHDGPRCSALFAEIRARFPAHANLGAAAPNGDVFCSALPASGPVNIADRGYFQRAVHRREFAVGNFLVGRISGRPSLNLAAPAIDQSGRMRAVVFVALDLRWLNHLAADAQLPAGSALTVLDGQGVVLARYPEAETWVGKAVPDAPIVKAILGAHAEGTAEAPGLDGVPRLYAFRRLPVPRDAGDLYISVGIPTAGALTEANRALAHNLLGLSVTSLVILAAIWVGGDVFILRGIRALLEAVTRLGTGDLSARTGLSYQGELGHLARSFDDMAANLERREAERERTEGALRDRELEYRRLVEGSIQGQPDDLTMSRPRI